MYVLILTNVHWDYAASIHIVMITTVIMIVFVLPIMSGARGQMDLLPRTGSWMTL